MLVYLMRHLIQLQYEIHIFLRQNEQRISDNNQNIATVHVKTKKQVGMLEEQLCQN